MDYIRKLASGHRNRYKTDGYNLDITYITPRIIAMSYPASGMEKMYRNPIKSVAKFLKEKHGDNYLVFNFSDRKYDYSKFDNRVEEYEWKDHHAPKIVVLFEACKRMFEFLEEDEK
jgi:predicted ATPase